MVGFWLVNPNLAICVLKTWQIFELQFFLAIFETCVQDLIMELQAQHFMWMWLKHKRNPKTTGSGNELSYNTNFHFCNYCTWIMRGILNPICSLMAWHFTTCRLHEWMIIDKRTKTCQNLIRNHPTHATFKHMRIGKILQNFSFPNRL